MKTLRHWLALVLLLAGVLMRVTAAEIPYYFYSFEGEPNRPFPPPGLKVLQGAAKPGESKNPVNSYLVLEAAQPHSAVLLRGRRLIAEGKTHFEAWVSAPGTLAELGEEFLDFDGAAVGLFRCVDAPDLAEFHAFHFTEDGNGLWISTGIRVAAKEEAWHSIGITHDWPAGTWSLEIDQKPALVGLGRAHDLPDSQFELWLFGQTAQPCWFDDLLISPVPPSHLEALQKEARRRAQSLPATFDADKTASTAQLAKQRRSEQFERPAHDAQFAEPLTLEASIEVIGGGRHLTSADITSDSGKPERIHLYSPGYDEDGKPKPLQVQIRCDGSLAQGVHLQKLSWAVTEHPKDNSTPLLVLARGTFATGPTQVAVVPSAYSNKALQIHVGELDFTEQQTPPE